MFDALRGVLMLLMLMPPRHSTIIDRRRARKDAPRFTAALRSISDVAGARLRQAH